MKKENKRMKSKRIRAGLTSVLDSGTVHEVERCGKMLAGGVLQLQAVGRGGGAYLLGKKSPRTAQLTVAAY